MKHSRSAFPLAFLLTALAALGCRAQAPANPLREEFRRLIMAERKAAPLNPQPPTQSQVGDVRQERVRFTTEEGQEAVVVINRPKEGEKFPAIIVQHFLGGTKDHLALVVVMNQLAKRGYLVAAIDGRFRGERQHGKSLDAAIAESLKSGKGHPFLIDTVYDDLRLLDYLQTRSDVDGARIGMTGFSEGGIETWMAAAADERIKVAVPIIGVTDFRDTFPDVESPEVQARVQLFQGALTDFAKQQGETEINGKVLRAAMQRLVPGLLDRFDADQLIPLVAPRPLLILNHSEDELFPVSGAKKVYETVKARYAELKAEDRVDFRVSPGKHAATASLFAEANSMGLWMDRWLKGGS